MSTTRAKRTEMPRSQNTPLAGPGAGVNGGSIGNGFGQPLGRRGWHARQIGRGQAGKPLRHSPAQPHVI
ncbi:MAG: hypothetical protein ACLQNE_42470 [Thermoguttaceae bacterium]